MWMPAVEPVAVLVADDNPVLAEIVRFNLQRAGFEVTVARDGEEAFQHLAARSYAALVVDYQMPRCNGEELCRRIRYDLGNTDLPICLLSAKGLELDSGKLNRDLGVSRVMFKPFSPSELVGVVKELCAGSAAARPVL